LSISHNAFDVDIIGVNEHGAMLELIYSGDINDLTDLEIKAELIQNGILEEEQAFNKLDGKLLAELTDAIYNLGELTVILQFPQELESLGGSKIELKIDYDRLYPWMHYIYGDSELANRFNYPWDPDNIEAWDLQPISDEFPTGEGHPVNSPCKGFVIQAGTESSQERNLWIYCEETGYYIELGHMDDDVSVDAIVDMHTFVGYINNETGWPHSHTKLRRPKSIITDHHDCLLETFDYADMFNPHVHLGGEPLPYGFWLEDTLPEEVRNAIEEGVFQWPE
jgi:hypothetical protein